MSGPVCVYGTGRLGLALAELARQRGVAVAGLWNRRGLDPERERRAAGFDPIVAEDPPAVAADLWLLAVPDDAVADIARRLAGEVADGGVRPDVAAHCSGALPVAALDPLAAMGIACGACHPVMTLRGAPDDAGALTRACVTLDGGPAAVRELGRLARALGIAAIPVAGVDRPRYHAALVLASNGRVALDAAAVRLLQESGLDERAARAVLRPLVSRTDENLTRGPLEDALTGPVGRGDAVTVRVQLDALEAGSDLDTLYRALGRIALSLVPAASRHDGHATVERLLRTNDRRSRC